METEFREFHPLLLCRDLILTIYRGGSEDVMLDLMVRQLAKNYKAKTKELEKSQASKL